MVLAKKALRKGKIDGKPLKDENSRWYQDIEGYLNAKAAFYQCHECKEPFFGGQVDCERDLRLAERVKKEELLCRKCTVKQIGGGEYTCKVHGHKYITWKCNFCCSEALYRCGSTYYCDRCHS